MLPFVTWKTFLLQTLILVYASWISFRKVSSSRFSPSGSISFLSCCCVFGFLSSFNALSLLISLDLQAVWWVFNAGELLNISLYATPRSLFSSSGCLASFQFWFSVPVISVVLLSLSLPCSFLWFLSLILPGCESDFILLEVLYFLGPNLESVLKNDSPDACVLMTCHYWHSHKRRQRFLINLLRW